MTHLPKQDIVNSIDYDIEIEIKTEDIANNITIFMIYLHICIYIIGRE